MSRQGKERSRNFKNIKKFWMKEAVEIGHTPQVTIRDHYFRIHEIHTFLPLIPSCSRILDIGCGTGFGTLAFARRGQFTLGIDYSEIMIEWANKMKDDPNYRKRISLKFSPLMDISYQKRSNSKVKFMVGDLLNLNIQDADFDVITGHRVLINLPSIQDQMKALKALRGYILEDGLLLLTEATLQGHERTDHYRRFFNLPILEKYWHNNYLDEKNFKDWKKTGWVVKNNLGFETYMLLSKVIYPAACGQENCQFLSGANAAAMEMASLFRTKSAVAEIGEELFFQMYVKRVSSYNPKEASKIESWISKNISKLPDWTGLGHQRLIIASPC